MTLKVYKAYNFRDKDPVIDELRTLVADQFGVQTLTGKELAAIERQGGPSIACQRGWWFGKTRRPTNATLEAAGRAAGFKRKWVRMRGKRQ